jgi:hypothetical protein
MIRCQKGIENLITFCLMNQKSTYISGLTLNELNNLEKVFLTKLDPKHGKESELIVSYIWRLHPKKSVVTLKLDPTSRNKIKVNIEILARN